MAEEGLGTARGKLLIDGSQAKREFKSTAASADDFRKKTEKSGLTAHDAMKKAGKGIAVASVGVVGGFLLAINAAANFESRISAISAVTGATAEDIDLLRKKALQLGKDTKFSASEAAQAMEELAKAGISLPDILNGAADATVNLAAAGEIALPEAATIASNAMNQFGLSAAKMPKIADDIAGAANASAIDVHDFGESLKQVGAVANLAGLSFHDTAVAIAEMGNAGIKGSDAGTSLKTFLSNLIPTTKQQIEKFQELKLMVFDNAKAMQFLKNNGVKPLSSNTDDLNAQLVQLSARLAGAPAGSAKAKKAYAELATSTGVMSNRFFDAKGNVKDLAGLQDVLQKSLKGQTKEQKLANLQILFGTDAIRAGAIAALAGAEGYDKMSDAMGKVSAADVAKKRMDNLKGSIEQLKGTAETLLITFGEAFQPIMKGLVDSTNGFLGSVLDLAANLPALITSAKGLAKDGLEVLSQAWHSEMVQRFVDGMARLIVVLQGPIASVLQTIYDIAKPLATLVGGVLLVAFDLIGRSLDAAADAAEFVSRNWDIIGPIVTTIGIVFLPLIIVLIAQLGILGAVAIASAVKQVKAWVMSSAAAAKSLVVMIITSTKLIAQWVLMGVQAMAGAIRIVAAWAIVQLAQLRAAASMALFLVLWVAQWIRMSAVAMANALRIAVAWLIALGPIALIVAAVILLAVLIALNMDKIKSAISATWNFIAGLTAKIWNAIVNGVRTAITLIVTFFQGMPARILSAVGGLGTLLYQKGRDVIQGMVNGIKFAIALVTAALGQMRDLSKRALSAAGTWLFDAGKALLQGFINGIKSMVTSVVNSAKDSARAAIDGVKGILHIGSPSRVFFDIGTDTMQGFINGVERMQKNAIMAVRTMAATVPTAFTATVAPGSLPSSLARQQAPAPGASGASNTWSPTVVVNNPPKVTTPEQVKEGLRRLEALHSPAEVLVG